MLCVAGYRVCDFCYNPCILHPVAHTQGKLACVTDVSFPFPSRGDRASERANQRTRGYQKKLEKSGRGFTPRPTSGQLCFDSGKMWL